MSSCRGERRAVKVKYAKTLEDRYDQVSCFGIAFYKKRCLIQKK